MKILSWNVNGIRAREKAGLVETLKREDADIVCLQEVRAKPEQLAQQTKDYFNTEYHGNWCVMPHTKAGYAGVMVATKEAPLEYYGKFFPDTDFEYGRQAILEYKNFFLICVYAPNAGRNLEKLDNRLAWEAKLKEFIQHTRKPVIVCGDMNVAPQKVDCNVFSKAGTSPEERAAFADLTTTCHLIDTYRKINPYSQGFTWFSNTYDSRSVNKGMRIDHFLVSEQLANRVDDIYIIKDKERNCASDHCQIIMQFNEKEM